MRIGFYTFSSLPIIGGAELLLHSLAESLTERGHQVTVWAPRVRGRDNRVAAHYRLRRYARPSSKRFGARQTLAQLFLQTWGRGPHVLHCHGAYPAGYVGAAYKRVTGTPLVIRPHGADILPGEWIDRDPRLRARLRGALLAADAVVAQGESLAERLRALGVPAEGLRIIHNGVRLLDGEPGPPADAPSVLAMGSLTAKKGFDVLLRAFALVLQCLPAARLTIAGEGLEGPRLLHLAASLGIADSVAFPGLVTGEAKAALLARARVFVSSSRREPFANANLEAMAAGRAAALWREPTWRHWGRDRKSLDGSGRGQRVVAQGRGGGQGVVFSLNDTGERFGKIHVARINEPLNIEGYEVIPGQMPLRHRTPGMLMQCGSHSSGSPSRPRRAARTASLPE